MIYFFLRVSTWLGNNTFVLSDFRHSSTWQYYCLNPLQLQCEAVRTIYTHSEETSPKQKNKVKSRKRFCIFQGVEEINKIQTHGHLIYVIISCNEDWFMEGAYRFLCLLRVSLKPLWPFTGKLKPSSSAASHTDEPDETSEQSFHNSNFKLVFELFIPTYSHVHHITAKILCSE